MFTDLIEIPKVEPRPAPTDFFEPCSTEEAKRWMTILQSARKTEFDVVAVTLPFGDDSWSRDGCLVESDPADWFRTEKTELKTHLSSQSRGLGSSTPASQNQGPLRVDPPLREYFRADLRRVVTSIPNPSGTLTGHQVIVELRDGNVGAIQVWGEGQPCRCQYYCGAMQLTCNCHNRLLFAPTQADLYWYGLPVQLRDRARLQKKFDSITHSVTSEPESKSVFKDGPLEEK